MMAAGMDEIAVSEISSHGGSGWSLLARPVYGLVGTEIVLPNDAKVTTSINAQDGGFTEVEVTIRFTGKTVGTRKHDWGNGDG